MIHIQTSEMVWLGYLLLAITIFVALVLHNLRKESRYVEEKEKEKTENVLTEVDMAKVTTAVRKAVELEKGKAQVNIAQAMDLIEALNRALGGRLYKLIREIPESEIKSVKS